MGSVEIDDKGLMASVTAPYEAVEAVLEATEGYVIAANKNSPKMTVIAGETEPVRAAMSAFEAQGFNAVELATSHAFHSRIVAPANEPLRRFLEQLEDPLAKRSHHRERRRSLLPSRWRRCQGRHPRSACPPDGLVGGMDQANRNHVRCRR